MLGRVDKPSRLVKVSLSNRRGSVEHYFHFLYGFLMPLFLFWETRRPGETVVVRSCGPMDRILFEVFGEDLLIVSKEAHQTLHENPLCVKAVTLDGFDLPTAENAKKVRHAQRALFERMGLSTEGLSPVQKENPHVVLIDRHPPHNFYMSSRAEAYGAGTERRSIPNAREIAHAMLGRLERVSFVALENARLRWQMALFNMADIIVAQHGAALANIAWCRPRARVIEIVPAIKLHKMKSQEPDWFGGYCSLMDMRHQRIIQNGDHSPVPVEIVLDTIFEEL